MSSLNTTTSTFLLLFILFCTYTKAQEHIGLKIENFSGINSVLLNPANNTSSQFTWDINIVSLGIFAETNYGYFRQASLLQVARNSGNIHPASDYNTEIPEDAIIFDYRDNQKRKYFSFFSNVMGPSAMVNLENISFGIFSNFRAVGSTQNLPPELNFYYFDRRPDLETFEFGTFSISAMAWSEIGVNFMYKTDVYNGQLGVGINLKFLQGYEAFYFKNNDIVPITQLPGDTTQMEGSNFDYGFTNTNISGTDFQIKNSGGGFAFDLGAIYTIDGPNDPYQLKLGVSLLDIGRINFRKNAEKHKVDTDDTYFIPQSHYTGDPSVDTWKKLFSYNSLLDSTASLEANSFKIWLPGAFSLQADYSLTSNIFINAALIQRIPIGEFSLQRGNLLSITPRFEHRWFGAALPIVLHNWQKLRVGAFLRLAFISIGSDNIGGLITPSDFSAMDFYFALKFNPFNTNFGGGIRSNRPKGKRVKCYDF